MIAIPTVSLGAYVAPAIDWLNANLHPLFAALSKAIETVLGVIEAALLTPPWFVTVALVASFAFLVGKARMALLAGLALVFCYGAGLWTASMQTIALVTVAVAVSVSLAFPLGVLAARFPRLEAILRPALDVMQTFPPWVYLIPAVMIFGLGRVPAIIATIVYGVPPMLRLTTLAFKQVPADGARRLEPARASRVDSIPGPAWRSLAVATRGPMREPRRRACPRMRPFMHHQWPHVLTMRALVERAAAQPCVARR